MVRISIQSEKKKDAHDVVMREFMQFIFVTFIIPELVYLSALLLYCID